MEEVLMLQIGDVLVSLDLAERYFCCDLSQCRGQCCIEGDAGAPLASGEEEQLQQVLPALLPDLPEESRKRIAEAGVAYTDEEGDRVTQLVDGTNCVFTTTSALSPGICYCAIDAAYRRGECRFRKPISCYLYPLRITERPLFTAVNYHRWPGVCIGAEEHGRRLGIRLYQFVREPLIERFGAAWYDELVLACEAYLDEYGDR